MEFLRRTLNPWGENVLVGVSWDLIWAAVAVGALFVAGHAFLVPKKKGTGDVDPDEAKGLPEKIVRHTAGARAFHWSMTVAMFVLLITAFLPLLGIRFPWVTVHWIAGFGLMLTLAYHVWHVFAKQDFGTMWMGRRDVEETAQTLKKALRADVEDPPRPGKYPPDQKMFHNVATLVTLGAVVTGVLMMFRIDHFLWEQNPYLLSDAAWGVVYVVHGACGIGLIFLVIAHVYFAVRPEKRWMTWSMINGWITRDRYLQNHDPNRWAAGTAAGRGGDTGSQAGGLDGPGPAPDNDGESRTKDARSSTLDLTCTPCEVWGARVTLTPEFMALNAEELVERLIGSEIFVTPKTKEPFRTTVVALADPVRHRVSLGPSEVAVFCVNLAEVRDVFPDDDDQTLRQRQQLFHAVRLKLKKVV